MGNTKVCETCGKVFELTLYGSRKYCSKECRSALTGRTKVLCQHCGKEFITLKNTVNKGNGKYCSRDCYNTAHYPNMVTKCLQCGKEFPTVLSRIKKGGEKFCSRDCYGLSVRGENSHLWKGGITKSKYCELFNNNFKRRVRAYFNNICVVCGKTHIEHGGNLCVHHVHYDKTSCCGEDVPRQFVILCRNCHAKTNKDREHWEDYFTKLINTQYHGKCYYTKEEYATYMSLL